MLPGLPRRSSRGAADGGARRARPRRRARVSAGDHPRRALPADARTHDRLPHRAAAARRPREGARGPAAAHVVARTRGPGELRSDRLVRPADRGDRGQRAPVWRSLPIPVADSIYRDPAPMRRPPRLLFVGRPTPHREELLEPIKRGYQIVHIGHGLYGELLLRFLARADVQLNLHNNPYPTFENRMLLALAAGHLVISEPLSPITGSSRGGTSWRRARRRTCGRSSRSSLPTPNATRRCGTPDARRQSASVPRASTPGCCARRFRTSPRTAARAGAGAGRG